MDVSRAFDMTKGTRFLTSSLTGVYSYASLRTSSEPSGRVRDRVRMTNERSFD